MDYKLELVLIPVSGLDRARDFYTQAAGVTLEVDGPAGEGARIVQVTPPGSACSVGFGTGLGLGAGHDYIMALAGSQRGLHLMVDDIAAARDELIARRVQVGEIRYMEGGRWKPGLDPGGAATCRSPSSPTPTATCGYCKTFGPDRTRRKETCDGTAR